MNAPLLNGRGGDRRRHHGHRHCPGGRRRRPPGAAVRYRARRRPARDRRSARRLRQRVNDGKADAAPTEALLARLECADSLEQLADCTLVIEAVAENLAIKQALFRDLEALCSPTTLFTSNTSSLSITAIAGALKHPARMAGLHFFNPAPLMKLVEIVSGPETGAETLAALQALAQRWGKQSVVCRSTPGFIVNRGAAVLCRNPARAGGTGG